MFLRYFILILLVFLSLPAFAEKKIAVSGWPFITFPDDAPPMGFGDDPFFGRLFCPPLVILDHSTLKSEDIIAEIKSLNKQKWQIRLKTGIYWWTGDPVTPNDIQEFFKNNITKIPENLGLESGLPDYKLKINNRTLEISWDAPPGFGPYSLTGLPFFKPNRNDQIPLAYICAGNFSPVAINNDKVVARSVAQYTKKIIEITFNKKPDDEADFYYFFPKDIKQAQNVEEAEACSIKVPTPFASAIVWNLKQPPTNQFKFRKIFEQVIPYDLIVKNLSAGSGHFINAPFPYYYGTYKEPPVPQSASLSKIKEQLKDYGYVANKNANNTTQNHNLTLKASQATPELIKKVLIDSFAAAGIKLSFIHNAQDSSYSGELTGLSLPVYTYSLLPFISSYISTESADPEQKQLLKAAKDYIISLSYMINGAAMGEAFLSAFIASKPLSFLMQHSVCLKDKNAVKKALKGIDLSSHSWFRDIVLDY